MCKEKLKVEKDGSNADLAHHGAHDPYHQNISGSKSSSNPVVLNGILTQNCDENCYFVEAKRIRVSVRNK